MSDHASTSYTRAVTAADSRMQSLESSSAPAQAPTTPRDDIARTLHTTMLTAEAAKQARRDVSRSPAPVLKRADGPVLSVVAPSPRSVATPSRDSRGRAGAPTARPATAATTGARRPAPAPAATARPSSAATSHAGSSLRRTGAKGGVISSPIGAADDNFTAKQLRALESEMAHLRETIDVLMEGRGVPSDGGSARGTSGLRVGGGSLSTGPMGGAAARGNLAVAIHEENMHLGAVSATLTDKHRHDKRVTAMQKESILLQDEATLAAAGRSEYARLEDTELIERTTAQAASLVMPDPVDLAAAATLPPPPVTFGARGGQGLTSSGAPAPPRQTVNDALTAAFADADRTTQAAAAHVDGVKVSNAGTDAPVASASTATLSRPASAPPMGSRAATPAAGGASRAATPGGGGLASTVPADGDHHFNHLSAAEMKRRKLASEGPVKAPEGIVPRSSSANMSKAEIAAKYAGLPGLKKHVASTTKGKTYSFVNAQHSMSIREQKVWELVEEKRAEEEAALKVKFKAMPIAPATADIGRFKRIMEKNEARRKEVKEKKLAFIKAHFKPFPIVNGHCDEAAARVAAFRAEAELRQQRELAASRVFFANSVPSSTSNPDSMYFDILRREAERPERVAANARALAATAALPPRMEQMLHEDRRKAAEKAAKLAAEERKEKEKAAFHANPIPDLAHMQAVFKRNCENARVAVTGAWRPVQIAPFSFDEPSRLAQERARKDAIRHEFEMRTSFSMDLRRRSKAFEEGDNIVPTGDVHLTRTGGLRGTLGVNLRNEAADLLNATAARSAAARRPSSAPLSITAKLSVSTAPPSAMTKSVKLKALAVQAKLRAQQTAAFATELGDERYDAFKQHSNAHFTPIFETMEAVRNPVPLSWQMDNVTAAASERAVRFRETSKRNAQLIRERVAAKQAADRPLMMVSAQEEAAAERARVNALVRIAKTTARATGGHTGVPFARGAADDVFDAEEREVLGSLGQ